MIGSSRVYVKNPTTSPVNVAVTGSVSTNVLNTVTAASVSVTDVQAALTALDTTRGAFTVLNSGSNPIAIVPSGTTFANAAIVLQANEIYEIETAAGAAWFVICGAGLTSTAKIYKYTP